MRYVHHVQQEVGVAHLVERGFERFHEMGREFAYEPYRVGEQEREVVDDDLAHGGVEGGKQLVFGKYIAFAQKVHEGGLAHVGVTHECHACELATVLALQ